MESEDCRAEVLAKADRFELAKANAASYDSASPCRAEALAKADRFDLVKTNAASYDSASPCRAEVPLRRRRTAYALRLHPPERRG